MGPKFLFLTLVFLLIPAIALAQTQVPDGKETIYAVIKDAQGERIEGYLHLHPEELAVSTKDDQEKSISAENYPIHQAGEGLRGNPRSRAARRRIILLRSAAE